MKSNSPSAKLPVFRFITHHSPFIIFIFLSSSAMFLSYAATGPSLGLFFAGFFTVTFLIPPATLSKSPLKTAIAIALIISAFWLVAVVQTPDTVIQWLQLCMTLIAYSAALAGITAFLSGMMPDIFASGATILLSLAWLTWPIWLAPEFPRLSTQTINHLISVHPPLVANGVLKSESPWTERTIAYRLTRLNQDIPVPLPESALPCILLNGLIALIFIVSARKWRKREVRAAI